jgi:glycosyltransferase involved in cell wall biosynthesis
MKPLVSILIPALNAEASIGETIGSGLAQTSQTKEIIIVAAHGYWSI